MKPLIMDIVKALVDKPDEVHINEVRGEHAHVLELRVAKDDLGKVIGKGGAHATAIRTLMRPGAQFLLTVPNQAGWAARYFGPAWFGLDLPRHLTHFTIDSLLGMLRCEGFRIMQLTTPGQSGWIRHSVHRARHPIGKEWLGTKTVSRAVSAYAVHRAVGETIYVVAE